ncbi:MAG: glycine cleavage system protein T, partial [Chloroflexi bacterium]|nr:glycine cleavage system protein T [Chloroflexota bacterium]
GASGLKKFSVIQNDEVIIGRGEAIKGDSFFVVAASEQLPRLRQQAEALGAVACDRDLYNVLRIESGIPEIDHEISEEYIPLEANLWEAVSFSKGCYIGQEIIARMESRGKLAKMLMGVESASPLMAGMKIEGGVITSVAESPRGGWIGLAYLKSPQAQAGTEIHHDDLVMRVASLPFAS